MLNVAVAGAAGRMGRTVIEAIQTDVDVVLTRATERAESEFLGRDAGEIAGVSRTGVLLEDKITDGDFDVLIDFSGPASCLESAQVCRKLGRRIVIGTTGLSSDQKKTITQLSNEISIVMAPNMSVGVNLCFYLVGLAARIMGEQSDIEIVEAHHRNKVDSPSGTALRLGEIAAAAVDRDLSEHALYGRQGQIGPRPRKTIGFSTIRGGDIVGEHSVIFAGDGERVEITHRSSSRMTFANGAIRAAKWSMQHDHGLYDMQDVLGLK